MSGSQFEATPPRAATAGGRPSFKYGAPLAGKRLGAESRAAAQDDPERSLELANLYRYFGTPSRSNS
jgi:hypothetical protein